MKGHSYTKAEINWLRKHRPELPLSKLTKKFNHRFDTNLKKTTISGTLFRNNIKSNRTGYFKPKEIPWNKGKKGLHLSPSTEFKKGSTPANTKPVGSEFRRIDGYIWVKIAEPRAWREKHVLLWESVNGPRPKGHSIIFIDQNPDNIVIENLKAVSRRLLLRLNLNKYKAVAEPLKPTVMALSELEIAVNNWDRI